MSDLVHELMQTKGDCALLESALPGGPLSRRSLLFRNPRAALVVDGRGAELRTPDGTRRMEGEALDLVRALLHDPAIKGSEERAVVGALAYDHSRPRGAAPDSPRLLALAVDAMEVAEVAAAVRKDVPAEQRSPRREVELARYSNLTRSEYRSKVAQLQEHIAAGDIYQANLSQRFTVPCKAGGLELYRRLRETSPAPFAGYFRMGPWEIVSASPERLLRVEGGRAFTRPIAGTRPRAQDPEADRALAQELILSDKERAEHLMLVDLARNDLGRVAQIGSVAVDELMVIEEYAQVRHIVSNVTARLAPGRDAFDALRALFPGGTITGVPKIRCMELLDEVEREPRGFYTGSLFYVTSAGLLDANILIRSALVADGKATFHAGGGIVADSVPDREYEETLHKAEGMRLALERI